MILKNEGSGDRAGVLKNVHTKFVRDWERGKGLARGDKNCVLNEWDFVEEDQEED